MKDIRCRTKPIIMTAPMGFVVTPSDRKPDLCIRLLGAAKGKLAFFDEPKTTTIGLTFIDGREDEVRALLETIELDDDDFSYSVTVPYVDQVDFLLKVKDAYDKQQI